MKKEFCLIWSLISILCLTSCGRKDRNVDAKTAAEYGTATVNDVQGSCGQSVFFQTNSDIAVAPEGYYCLNHGGNGRLTYISKDGAREIYLCGKPDCRHVDEETGWYTLENCNAYVGSTILGSIVYWKDAVYLLQYDRDTHDVTLARVNADGSVHEELMVVGQVADNTSCYSYVFTDDNTILMVQNEFQIEKENRVSLDRIDLGKKEKISVTVYEGTGVFIDRLKVLNNNVFFMLREKDPDSESEEYGYLEYLMRYDIGSGEVMKALQNPIDAYTIADNGLLFYFVAGEGLYQCNLKTMEIKLVRECDEDTVYGVWLAYDGTYLYLENYFTYILSGKTIDHRIFVCSLEGEIINSIPGSGFLHTEIADGDYMLTKWFSEDMGQIWAYIKKSDITDPDVTWSIVERQ